jgi:preprotein translocase subunit SecA
METPLNLAHGVRNPIGWRQRLSRLQGAAVRFDLRRFDDDLAAVAGYEDSLRCLSDEDLEIRARDHRTRAVAGESIESLQASLFALTRETARRRLGQRPFDVQIVAALALERGAVVEMQTGEGKTLTAVMPAALDALTGRGVHVLTFNDYLARRDAEWMGPVYRALGLSVAYVQQGMDPAARRQAYRADVTYVTAKEAGFDHLRDLLVTDPGALVHRPFHSAIVDEADSLMIDEARVPLVIAGGVGRRESLAPTLAGIVSALSPALHFTTDEYGRDVSLTEAGIEHVERVLGCGSLHGEGNYLLLTELNCALHANALLRRDVDYIVRNGRISLIDEFTGRVVEDRHWPDGLQAALEAKEGLEQKADGRILGSITLQHFFRGYSRRCGMTGTAQEAASELREFYGVEVVVIPTHRPMVRVDHHDAVFTDREAKERAVAAEITRANAAGRPVLVGTSTVEESERLATRIQASGIRCQVLNAKNDEAEARIIAGAGAPGAVTISTNMAGRGTDIRLGGENEADRARVVALGGLYVIGTNRHESRRVDLQLRGRAGRQGDPGESRFFTSLQDPLLVRYGIKDLIPTPYLPEKTDAPIDNPVIRREIARAQRIIEGQNFEIRRTISRYNSIVEHQRQRIIDRRSSVLHDLEPAENWTIEPADRAALVSAVGEAEVRRAERAVTLFEIDSAWRDHLSLCADLREGIHLVRLGGQDPLASFSAEIIAAFSRIDDTIDTRVAASLHTIKVRSGELDLSRTGLTTPASTWTYLVNDDPFRDRIGALLTGPGGATVAIYSALMLMPLLILWGLVDRLLGRRSVSGGEQQSSSSDDSSSASNRSRG